MNGTDWATRLSIGDTDKKKKKKDGSRDAEIDRWIDGRGAVLFLLSSCILHDKNWRGDYTGT